MNVNKPHAAISAGADVNAKDNYGNTPLMQAARYDHKGIVQMLKDAGTRVIKLHIESSLWICNKLL